MPFQLIKTTKECYKVIGKGVSQILIEGDLIVPDIKADIANILRVGARAVIEEEKAGEERIGFKGNLCVNIIYMAKKSEKPIYNMKDSLSFEDFINIDGINRLSDVDVVAKLSHVEYKLINDRKIGIKAIVTISACGWEKKEEQYLQNAQGDGLQIKEGIFTHQSNIENKKDRFVIKESFNLGSNKREIADIIECDVNITHKDVKAMRGSVNIKGDAIISLLYTGHENDNIMEQAEFIMPFNGTIEMPQVKEDMQIKADLKIEKIEPYILSNDSGEDKILDVEISIGAMAGATMNSQLTYIADIYSMTEELECEFETIENEVITGKNEARVTIRDTLILENTYPDIMQVVKSWGKCYVDNITPYDNSITVEGAIGIQMMYIAKDDALPMQVADFMIPFEQTIELNGVSKNSNVDFDSYIEKININMLTGREIDANIMVVMEAVSEEITKKLVISNIKESPKEKINVASIIIYVTQKGDTLWEIAKKYNTTIENILMVNDIENPDLIYPGQKLLIIKFRA